MTYDFTQDDFWAGVPKGTKSCRTQGDFCSFVHLSVRPSVRLSIRNDQVEKCENAHI